MPQPSISVKDVSHKTPRANFCASVNLSLPPVIAEITHKITTACVNIQMIYDCEPLPLISNQHDDHVGVRVLASVLQPSGEVVECVPPGDVVHEQGACRAPVVRPRDRSGRDVYYLVWKLKQGRMYD